MSNEIIIIETPLVIKSLCWDDDNLIDFANGGNIFEMSGKFWKSCYSLFYEKFDAAVISPSRRYGVAYEKLGTKGAIFYGSKMIREINRSFGFSESYEYPVVLFQLPDGREVIAHCPEKGNRLEIEELETGKRLNAREDNLRDYSISRLVANVDGSCLLSAGWVWGSADWFELFDVAAIVGDSPLCDSPQNRFDLSAEVSSACFLSNTTVILSSSAQAEDFDEDVLEERSSAFRPGSIGMFDLQSKTGAALYRRQPKSEQCSRLTTNTFWAFTNIRKL